MGGLRLANSIPRTRHHHPEPWPKASGPSHATPIPTWSQTGAQEQGDWCNPLPTPTCNTSPQAGAAACRWCGEHNGREEGNEHDVAKQVDLWRTTIADNLKKQSQTSIHESMLKTENKYINALNKQMGESHQPNLDSRNSDSCRIK